QPYIYPFVSELCVTVDPKTRKWSTTYCLPQTRNYICKVPSTQLPVVPSNPKPAKSQCQNGWKYVSVTKKCYKISSSIKSWYAALYDCRSQGGDLAVARTEAANLAIT
ncbi:macrophage mannose receptor 1-like protein, partial [Aphelenchoides avenae]